MIFIILTKGIFVRMRKTSCLSIVLMVLTCLGLQFHKNCSPRQPLA